MRPPITYERSAPLGDNTTWTKTARDPREHSTTALAAVKLCTAHALSDAALLRDRHLQMSEDEIAELDYAAELS